MTDKLILVLDCGASNVRCIAVNTFGELLVSHSVSNTTRPDPHLAGGLIWDIDEIWNKILDCTKIVIGKIDKSSIAGITVTSFGVDGAPVKKDGTLLFPVISWACDRTIPVMEAIEKYIPREKLYQISGVQNFSFNTIHKLIWLKEHHPEIMDKMDQFLFISSIFLHRLSKELVTETTMAGTSMLTDWKSRSFSDTIFNAIGVENKFPRMVESGELVGYTTPSINSELGIPHKVPVFAAGHDTQFAVYGAGAKENEVVLSSGTWEILMARTKSVGTNTQLSNQQITHEFDAVRGFYNPGIQWLGSGILEWLIALLYKNEKATLKAEQLYDLIIAEARAISNSWLQLNLDFLHSKGSVSNLNLNCKREEIFRAALDQLAKKAGESLKLLESSCGFRAESVLLVGGGSKNKLWNEIRARELNIPLKVIGKKETTVLGAALFALAGAGIYRSPDEARKQVDYQIEIPGK